jgi:2,4-dienoyl-CoA reductase-like NADH-dependent reductase (Old Yellow Enzyme family)
VLFDPLTLRSLEIRNRLWVAPMCQYSVFEEDGVPTDWQLVHLGALATGGPGLILTEATAVAPEGRISPRDTGIWNDEQAQAWRRITDVVRGQGARIAVQLAHAGRKASSAPQFDYDGPASVPLERGGWQTVSASTEPFPGYAAPRALRTDEIPGIVQAFADAARRAADAGFDAVEVHAAHGYLLHQFLSPLTNDRVDEYGGSAENRARIVVDVVRAVRAAIGDDMPILVRFSASDWLEGGVTAESTAQVAQWTLEAGADFFDVSTGGLAPATIPIAPGYQVPFARRIKEEVGAPVGAVGLITTAQQAEEVLADGVVDAVLMAREWLRDPHFALRAATELGVEIDYWPAQYLRARP